LAKKCHFLANARFS